MPPGGHHFENQCSDSLSYPAFLTLDDSAMPVCQTYIDGNKILKSWLNFRIELNLGLPLHSQQFNPMSFPAWFNSKGLEVYKYFWKKKREGEAHLSQASIEPMLSKITVSDLTPRAVHYSCC